jgi:nucleotide-binding universal stress UspA family protein
MKKILCPIDFSESSRNGLEYAARLAQILKARLTLLYVRISVWPEAIQLQREVNDSNDAIGTRLESMANETRSEFNIPCHYHFEPTTLTLEEVVAAHAANADLVVMGTNGAEDYYQYVMGSNSFHVIEKSTCPVLIVPEKFSFRPVRHMVYAYDPETNPLFLIDQLKKLAGPLGARVTILHIEEDEPSAKVDRRMEILQQAVAARTASDISWNFDSEYAHEVSWALDEFMQDKQADMLALSFHHRTLMENLFKENTIKKISSFAEYPVFVF